VTKVNALAGRIQKDPDYATLNEYAQKDAAFAPVAAHAQTAIATTIPKAYADYNNPQDRCTQPNNPQAAACKLALDNMDLSLPMILTAVDGVSMLAHQHGTSPTG
jgi:hypothetical protein